MMAEINLFQETIKRGPGWSQDQSIESDDLTYKIDEERKNLERIKDDLRGSSRQIEDLEDKIRFIEIEHPKVLSGIAKVDNQIETIQEVNNAKEEEKSKVESELELIQDHLHQRQEDIKDANVKLQSIKSETKSILECIKDTQAIFNGRCNDCRELNRKIENASKDVKNQTILNEELEVQNRDKANEICEMELNIQGSVSEAKVVEKKREIIAQKILEVEKIRVDNESKCDELKVKLQNVENVELKIKRKEIESQKLLHERLNREIELLDRKKDISCKSSNVVKDLISNNEATMKALEIEYDGLCAMAREYHSTIKSLTISLVKERDRTDTAIHKRKGVEHEVGEKDIEIDHFHKRLGDAESKLKHKQNQCDTVQTECNLNAKKLAESLEEFESAKREHELLNRQTKQMKSEIVVIENNLIMEHYNHHHANEEREHLKLDLEDLRKHISLTEQKIEDSHSDLSALHKIINEVDLDCEKLSHEYKSLIVNRDLIGAQLVQKNDELLQLKDKIKIQNSNLQHSEVKYKDLMTQLADTIANIKTLYLEKQSRDEDTKTQDEIIQKVRSLESEIHREKIKSAALREEIGRPLNVHRWRSLEQCDPTKFEMIKEIHKLQKQIISTADAIAEKDIMIRENERTYMQIKRICENQPQLSEIQDEIDAYQANLKDKVKQMKELEFEIGLQKSKLEALNKELKKLRDDKKRLDDSWVQHQMIQLQ